MGAESYVKKKAFPSLSHFEVIFEKPILGNYLFFYWD